MYHNEWQNYNDFYNFAQNKKITVTGTVIDISKTVINNRTCNAITLWLNTIAAGNSIRKSNKTIIFYQKNTENIIVGDTITLNNISCKKPAHVDFQKYQIKEQIVATIFNNTLEYTIINHPSWSLRNWIWNQKQRLLASLQTKLSNQTFRFFSSLFLGNRTCIKNELQETNDQFKTWGISHFLARSGLHLVLFIFIWQALFCIIPLPFFIKQIIITLLSFIYFILTWTSAPFTRSFALFILNKLCWFGKIPFHLLHYLSLVCLLFLLYCPLYIFFLDFQLSFILTFALAWFNQVHFVRTDKPA